MAKMKQLKFDLDNSEYTSLKNGLYQVSGNIYYDNSGCSNCEPECQHEFKEIVLLTSSVFECIYCGKEKKS